MQKLTLEPENQRRFTQRAQRRLALRSSGEKRRLLRAGECGNPALMRILYSHRTKSADGQYVHIRALTDALRARGHDLTLAGPEDDDGRRKLDADAGASALRRALPRPLYEAAELLYSVPGYLKLETAARACRPDLVYERYNLFYHSGMHLARSRRLPFLLEVNAPLAQERAAHGGLSLKDVARRSERVLWRSADAVFPVTGVLARAIERAGAAPERIHVNPNGVEPDFLNAADGAEIRKRYGLEGKVVLGFTGFLRDWHRLDAALDYLRASDRRDLHLLIVGDGPARVSLQGQISAAGLEGRVTITGVVQRDDVAAHVAAFDIALQPAAVAYASPLKLFEYMAQGRAIIAPDQDNIREVLTAGEDALLFAPDKAADFARGLDALASDPSLRARLGAAAMGTLRKRDYTWTGAAARVETVAHRLLERRQ